MTLWHQLTGVVAAAMLGIVSVFLVIGGTVIMNVMLASVSERMQEIGIRMAMGARRSDILMQFLVESSLMSAMGGAIGILISVVIALLVRTATPIPVTVSPGAVALALGISTAVGLVFGIYPAGKAARLDPIEALRCEA